MNLEHVEGIGFHYDLPIDFYNLFLGGKRFYTSAKFCSPTDTLEQAQLYKINFLLDLLAPKAGERIEDFGCGWGMGIECIAERTGTYEGLLGYTLSREQYEYNRTLGYNVVFEDFIKKIHEPESLDGILDIGSYEHIGPDELGPFYKNVFNALRPGGRMVSQFFSLNREPFPMSMVMAELFFPGSVLSMHSDHLQAAEATGFVTEVDVEDCYKRTLRAWYGNLVLNRNKAIEMVGIKIYNNFLTFFPLAWKMFDLGDATLHRIKMVKPING